MNIEWPCVKRTRSRRLQARFTFAPSPLRAAPASCGILLRAAPCTPASFAADIVIVGASFAGAACAIAAAQRGLRVCVLERKRDPGEKLRTTGIIVKEAAERTLLNADPRAR